MRFPTYGFFNVMKIKTIKIPLYHGYIHISVRKKLDCSGYVERDKTPCIYWIVLKKRSLSHGLMAHEIVHLVNMIMADRGFKPDFNNDEAQAYLTEWVTEQIYNIVKIKN